MGGNAQTKWNKVGIEPSLRDGGQRPRAISNMPWPASLGVLLLS